ncbi:hypothetical protein [Streptomyces sp. NBC_01431]|uniref:hypothetical protein n=1 Tax=Streptomyces sp. NBC_01431 TaxID=2903863 RepID=UPI002E340903|nr:hypothetical protein [Streptomyces sp. NBC_01431]
MPDSTTLQSQYAAQIQSDLDSNVTDREQIAAQITTLQEQLSVLENNHALLTTMQQALGDTDTAAPTPGKTAKATKGAKGAKAAKKTAEASAQRVPQARTAPKSAARTPKKQEQPAARTRATGGPTLRELVAAHLAKSDEPRSAAEITEGLTAAHPDRNIANTVVRNTLENLVAKGQAQRTRQNRSVFYTSPDGASANASAGAADTEVKKEADAVTPVATA